MFGDLQQHKTWVIWDIQVSSLTTAKQVGLNCFLDGATASVHFRAAWFFILVLQQTVDSNSKGFQAQFSHWALSLRETITPEVRSF